MFVFNMHFNVTKVFWRTQPGVINEVLCVMCNHYNVLCCVFAASGGSKDMMPGPYPKTPEERAAAAKKYNMTLEDYQPFPDDGQG